MDSIYANWSAENATKAYLKTIRMGIKRPSKDLDASEFISAIAAGNNAKLIVVLCGETTMPSTLLALLAATSQTMGRIVCIFHNLIKLEATKQALNQDADLIEFVIGGALRLIREDYQEADFVLNDCKLENHEALLRAMQLSCESSSGAIVLGCNAFCTKTWEWSGFMRTQLLPIGDGLLVTRITRFIEKRSGGKSHWIVRVDELTGEEHVFRVRSTNDKQMVGVN